MKAGIEEMATDSQFLFVYGTLMGSAASGYGRDMRERLHRESRSYGAATMQGRLYDLGSYPAVNRLKLLSEIRSATLNVADFSKIAG